MNTARNLAGPWFPNVNLYLYTEKRKKGRRDGRRGEGPPRYDNAGESLAGLTGNLAAEREGRGRGGRQKRIMDTMLDGARSGSRRAGACTRPRRAFEKITSSGCLFAFGYLEEREASKPSSTSNSICCSREDRFFPREHSCFVSILLFEEKKFPTNAIDRSFLIRASLKMIKRLTETSVIKSCQVIASAHQMTVSSLWISRTWFCIYDGLIY